MPTMNIKSIVRCSLVLACLLNLCQVALAQRVDTLALIRQLIKAGTASRQLPMHLEMELKSSTNFITSEADTASTRGSFYLLPQASYIRIGEAEQLLTDSLSLVVSNKLQRMMLYKDGQSSWMSMAIPGGPGWQDSSTAQIAAKYIIQYLPSNKEGDAYTIADKRLLQATTLPREWMQIQLEAGSNRLRSMTTIKRTLVPLSAADYASIRQNVNLADKLVNISDKEYYLIREQETSFIYTSISHDPAIRIPVVIADRVRRDQEGAFQPVEGYKNFVLTVY
jgi:hypothetical protein